MKRLMRFTVLSPLIIGLSSISLVVTSCSASNSLDTKLKNLLNTNIDELISISLVSINSNEKIKSVDTLFSNKDVFKIEEKEKIKEWNNNLSENERKLYEIKPKIKNVNIPYFEKSNKEEINEIDILIDLSTGPIDRKFVNYKLNIKENSQIENKIIEEPNFTNKELVFINKNQYKKELEKKINDIEKWNLEDIKNDPNKINNLIIGENDSDEIFQDFNVYFNEKNSPLIEEGKIVVFVYFSKKKLSALEIIEKETIYFELNDVRIKDKGQHEN